MKRDLFVTDFWEFDFPYHEQFKSQISEYVSRPHAQKHIEIHSSETQELSNPSLNSYGGDELPFEDDKNIFSFFQTQIKKLLLKVQAEHDWDKGEWGNIDPWLNINQKGNFNPPHIHPGNDYSGCYIKLGTMYCKSFSYKKNYTTVTILSVSILPMFRNTCHI